MRVMEKGVEVAADPMATRAPPTAARPHVSAMMVTQNRPVSAMRAVRCFLAQSWAEAELVIIDDDPSDLLQARVDQLPAPERERIAYHRLPARQLPLGALRNIAVERARGPLVCQWDDDDIYHPDRIGCQVEALLRAQAQACSLWRHQMLWSASSRLCFSVRRLWEGSLLCDKARLPTYPQWRRGEDTPVTEALVNTGRFVLLDAPELYTYIVHGNNTFGAAHFEEHWRCATQRFAGQGFVRQLRRTAAALPAEVKAHLLALSCPPGSPSATAPRDEGATRR